MIVRLDDATQGWCAVCEIYVGGRIITSSSDTRANSRGVVNMNCIAQGNCGHTGVVTATAKNRCNGLNIAKINDTFTGVYSGYIVIASDDVRTQ